MPRIVVFSELSCYNKKSKKAARRDFVRLKENIWKN